MSQIKDAKDAFNQLVKENVEKGAAEVIRSVATHRSIYLTTQMLKWKDFCQRYNLPFASFFPLFASRKQQEKLEEAMLLYYQHVVGERILLENSSNIEKVKIYSYELFFCCRLGVFERGRSVPDLPEKLTESCYTLKLFYSHPIGHFFAFILCDEIGQTPRDESLTSPVAVQKYMKIYEGIFEMFGIFFEKYGEKEVLSPNTFFKFIENNNKYEKLFSYFPDF